MNALARRHYVKLPFDRLLAGGLEYMLENGLRPEICFEAHHADELEPEDVRPVAAALERRGLDCTIHCPFLGLDFGSPDQAERTRALRALERTMRLAEALRPEVLVVHGGQPRLMRTAEYAEWNDRALPLIERAARLALELGSRAMVENICHTRPEQLAPILDALDGAAGWCLDAGHLNVFSSVPPEQWIERLGRRLGQLHLHDNDGSADQHRAVGRGRIDYPRLFAAITRLHPDLPPPVATLEVRYDTDVQPSLDALAPLWPWNGPVSKD